MASNGSVAADWNPEPAEESAEADSRGNQSPSPTKPEVARKPHLPGNKPRPPVPKKPPVAHKPPSPLSPPPSALCENHGSITTPPGDTQHSNLNSDSTNCTAAAKLSPSAHHPSDAVVQNAEGQPGGRGPPPPLPKAPPKGPAAPAPSVKRPKAAPPRPAHLPPPKKTPPPVAAKRRPVLPPDDKGLLQSGRPSLQEPSPSYEQVVVEENVKSSADSQGRAEGLADSQGRLAGSVDERQECSAEDSLPGNVNSSSVKETRDSSKQNSYQQVIVEENSKHGAVAAGIGACVAKRDKSPGKHRPQAYENVDPLRNKAQGSPQQTGPASVPVRSYDKVVVEENSRSRIKPEGEGEKKDCEIHEGEGLLGPASNTPASGSGDCANTVSADGSAQDSADTHHTEKGDCGSGRLLTVDQTCHDGDQTSGTNTAPADNLNKSVSQSDSVTSSVEGHSKPEPTGRKSVSPRARRSPRGRPPDRPSRPAPVPPPVQPKPKKRISLLKQSAVVPDEEAEQLHPSSQATEEPSKSHSPAAEEVSRPEPRAAEQVSESHLPDGSSPQSGSHDNFVEEALYQEIDELDLPADVPTEGSRSSAREGGGSSVITDIAQDSSSLGQQSQESKQAQAENEHSVKDNNNVDDKSSEDNNQLASKQSKSLPQIDRSTKQTSGDGTNDGGANTTTRKSPETTLEEDVGETSFMLKEIEQILKARLGSSGEIDADNPEDTPVGHSLTASLIEDSPVRPPRPRRADKLRRQTITSCSVDFSSTESLNSVGQSGGKKAPPKPRRKKLPSVTRSSSDVTDMRSATDDLEDEEKEEGEVEDEAKPFLPPRQQSLCRLNPATDPKPPPLPPRNKSMDRSSEGGGGGANVPPGGPRPRDRGQSGERRCSVPNPPSGSTTPKVARSSSGSKRKHIPRPTRRAPPPPSHPPVRPLTMAPASGGASQETSATAAGKVPGYQKITAAPASATTSTTTTTTTGSSSNNSDINMVVPKVGVVGCHNSPGLGEITTDHDYHEIPDHLVRNVMAGAQDVKDPESSSSSSSKTKEETPPPSLPPRSYKPPVVGPAEKAAESSKNTNSESNRESLCKTPDPSSSAPDKRKSSISVASATDSSNSKDAGSEEGRRRTDSEASNPKSSAEDSASQCSPLSSRPESFSSEVMGSLSHIVGDRHRPMSAHSSSSHSDPGSGGGEVPIFDHSSGSESEGEPDEEKIRLKREKKVYYIAEEVVKSEKVFVDVLRLLNVDFRKFMSDKAEQVGHPIVPTETLNKILDFLPELQSFNEMLLKDLTDRIAHWDQQKKISDIFVKKGPFLKLYSSYIRNFANATALLDETCKKHGVFGMALQEFQMTPRCAMLELKQHMLKPIQRIPQYKLLLQDYLKHLTKESPDYKDTISKWIIVVLDQLLRGLLTKSNAALNIVSEVADHANESMRHGDDVQKLLEIQRSLIGQFEVIQPGRVLRRQGELMKLSRKDMQPRMFFLFSDVLLYTTPTATGYRLNNILPLQGMKVLPPKLEEFKNEFNIITTQRSFTVATSTPEEREAWLRALWNAIEENSERYHTFKAMQPEPKTSLLDKDFVLGTKAPLWVPDARVTMCMNCLAEFSIAWRRHHCRACGRIICGYCSENKAPLRYLKYKSARVCDECFEKLAKEVDEKLEKGEDVNPVSPTSTTAPTTPTGAAASAESMGLSFSSLKARFQKIRKSGRDKRKSRPSVLKEVHANDEGSNMSGYLWVAKHKKWKRLWFVVKGKVLYTYKASEDMAAIESMPLLGFEVTRLTSWYQGAEPDLMFELQHQNTQPLVFKPRSASSSSSACGSERNSVAEDSGSGVHSPLTLSPHVKSSADTTTPRLIFRTDSAAATTKWLNVLREASMA